jgi:glycogen debranching enzyme
MPGMQRAVLVTTPVIIGLLCALALTAVYTHGQQNAADTRFDEGLAFNTQVVAPHRFIAVHGRRALIAGYATSGLEAWAYPFQILSGYRVAFRTAGATTAINGSEILSRVLYEPDSITRIYLGSGFIVHEKLFVPLDRPGVILTYTVQSKDPVDIEIHATPILNLMWPAALGGQSVAWNADLRAFVLSEPVNGFSALVGSPEIVAHDEPGNATTHSADETGIAFTLRPASAVARLFLVLNSPHAADTGLSLRELMRDRETLEAQAADHWHEFESSVVRLETPDERVNRAFAWSEIALDQAWVCNPDLGCGYVAGYGPSRGARRPQYDWFFAGDGLIAADAALRAGDRAHARDEIEFILRYQGKKTGMIWHELSQSAGFLDWTGKYPYMFVHVDITFQFLGAVTRYVIASGDIAFAREHWAAIEAAYRYCQSLIDRRTALPGIPEGKEGGNEQDRMTDDLGLSTAWVEASSSFAQLATLTGHNALAADASRDAQEARSAIPSRYWDTASSFWIGGHTHAGGPMLDRRSGPPEALALGLFDLQEQNLLLDQLASAPFQTDWGARGVGAGSAAFDPESYAKGSVWPVHTAGLADAFWSEHRPLTALALWQSLVPLASLDSLGHMPEVLAGDFYRPQSESVPEQTWSSAGFVDATIHGLLGLESDSISHRLTFAPRTPDAWSEVSVSNVQVAGAEVSLKLHRVPEILTLQIDNAGEPLQFNFVPNLPLGSRLQSARFNQRPVAATMENRAQQTDATMSVTVPHGRSELEIDWQGGVSLFLDDPEPLLGEPSVGVRIVNVHLDGTTLAIDADVPCDRDSHLRLQTAWSIVSSSGAQSRTISGGQSELTLAPPRAAAPAYCRVHVTVEFKP